MTGIAMPTELVIRDAEAGDLPGVQHIYAQHVERGLGSFEEQPPGLAEIVRRHAELQARNLPFLVAETDGAVRGYAYAGPFRPRSAYRHTLEDSVYVDPALAGRGIGRALLTELVARCAALGYRQLIAVIGDSGNVPSIRLHAALGFEHAGLLYAVGLKHGRWVDIVMMQRPLGPGSGDLPSRNAS